MDHHVGIDVPLELSSLCVLDAAGKVIREAKIASEPEALVAFLRRLDLPIARVGMEAGLDAPTIGDAARARCNSFPVSRNASPGTATPIENALTVARWQSVQWHV